jgi:SAM-dependent methyltransferase
VSRRPLRANARHAPTLPRSSRSDGPYSRRRLDGIAARWDARAPDWDQALKNPACHLNEDDAYRRFLRAARQIIRQRQAFCSTHGVIDAGCGTGLVLAAVLPAFAWGIGVDISQEMLRIARSRQLKKATFVSGDCFELPTLCSKAGAVLSRGVLLSHYGRRQALALLKAAHAALVAHGFILFDFLNQDARARSQHAPENKTWFTATEVCSLARRAGFAEPSSIGSPDCRVLLLLAEA